MASIFTFDPDPPRVSSPWATTPIGIAAQSPAPNQTSKLLASKLGEGDQTVSDQELPTGGFDYTNITRLAAEPQDGPTEYKLHLLLRRRRSFTRASNGRYMSGSMRASEASMPVPVGRNISDSGLLSNTPPPLASTQSRHHRLEQLTTQLLWRLQQSCPYHISSSMAPVVPHLPDDARLSAPDMPQRLLPGLEESKGALYEIGVADDGTIVGLAEDEMEESLNNLRAMAASLGCGIEVLRRVPVGECEWVEDAGTPQQRVLKSQLLVAEALVRPQQHLLDHTNKFQQHLSNMTLDASGGNIDLHSTPQTTTEQMRVSVIGATMSGKSTLLGTLSTATLDNGRGKSRLSLLKHRHEIASGMTSSVTQELIGYRDDEENTQVISYGSGDVSSWIDIHAAVEAAGNGRLVFLSDSAGHPRFRRTTVRGIVGWQPHWTLLCVPSDNSEDSSTSEDSLGPAAVGFDLSHAHLQLCLALELPLVIVITKYDLATKNGLRSTILKLFAALRDHGRNPYLITEASTSVLEADLHTVEASNLNETEKTIELLKSSPLGAVPVVLTSAIKGIGIQKLHAFLRRLPMPTEAKSPPAATPSPLFYIEDVYSICTGTSADRTVIIGGHLRYGSLTVGDELLLGPYPVDVSSDDSDSSSAQSSRKHTIAQSRSFSGALSTKSKNTLSRDQHSEWRRVRITSLRNLRLPVRTLHADQVGTMAMMPVNTPICSPSINRIRKGMVLCATEAKAHKTITVRFQDKQAEGVKGLGVGTAVVVYIASVRASSKVVSVAIEVTDNAPLHTRTSQANDDTFSFGFDDEAELDAGSDGLAIIVTFQFIASHEFVEPGAKVLVMPGGGPGLFGNNERGAKGMAGLKGFVGRLVEDS
ncbi:gtp-binding 2 [Pyrenophora seminiperda CCB06]|uniref:Gtp-binding 2 n=1 Tax=Pyrenophora seminiperda CCB06 TaxID=1302712 RepID=A0A3M7M705_9PLEO|nr:gtp-binding 2 [Pyrenophora seminiperda CCB06]